MAAELNQKIRKQIEYYFGDMNLARDKFLRDLLGKEDGWIPIETLLTFNRLKALTEKPDEVAAAFEESASELIELNEAKDKLRRTTPLTEADEKFKTDLNLRTIHFRGFPRETATLDELIEFCSQYGEVEHVNMRRFPDKKFKGCCMTVYKSVDSANKALASDDKFKGETAIAQRENKEAYLKRKSAGKSFKKAAAQQNKEENTEEKKEDEKPAEEELKYESGCILKLIDLPENLKYREMKEELFKHAKVQYVDIIPETRTGAIRFASKEETEKALKVFAVESPSNGAGEPEKNGSETNGAEKSDEAAKTNDDAKTEESKDEAKTEEANADDKPADDKPADETKEKSNGSVSKPRTMKIKDLLLTFTVLDGDEEKEYWQKVRKIVSGQKQNHNKGRFHHNKGRGGRFHNNGRFKNKRGASDDNNNAKRAKVDN